ncbi:hypothetical protein PT974_03606 [Cladobotryum mycophilum]|uniref:Uncharacterized protein n=1 Tax=Cladobotryum mycophilum TaxID=491253 RepID=A0ABR0SSX4_9HYPO
MSQRMIDGRRPSFYYQPRPSSAPYSSSQEGSGTAVLRAVLLALTRDRQQPKLWVPRLQWHGRSPGM